MLTRPLIIYFLLLALPFAAQANDEFSRYVKLRSEKRTQEAYESLLSLKDNKLKEPAIANKYFAMGLAALDFKQYGLGREHLEKALALKHENTSHINYLIGHSYKEEGKHKEATAYFAKVMANSPPQNIAYLTRFESSEIALATNQYTKAIEHLNYLERRWRRTPRYPEVVWRLMEVEFSRNRRVQACKWARRLYSSHAGHPVVHNWSFDLRNNEYGEGKKVGCVANLKDQRSRIRRLQLSGQAQKARAEIDRIREESSVANRYEADMLMVGFLESSGFPEDALQILIPYHATHQNSVGYQSTLAKVAARAGEYPTAIGAHYKAYGLSSGSASGRSALFSSAFLSYQTQDYDGATRKFGELIKRYPNSGLARDSKWHLAWLTYLRGDYSGAEKSFTQILNDNNRGRRRRVSSAVVDRTKYWLAVSMLKQEKYQKARPIFEEMSKDQYLSYYSLAARTRLALLPSATVIRGLASVSSENGAEPQPLDAIAVASPSVLYGLSGEKEAISEESESEENLQADAGISDESESVDATETNTDNATLSRGAELRAGNGDSGEDGSAVEDPSREDLVQVTSFRDPKLQAKFVRAQNLIAVGEYEWAKWELYDIESRTRNKSYLRNLMELYTRIGSYNRASYIAETHFTRERGAGVDGARDYWSFNFPEAYGQWVKSSSKRFNIPNALVLSIMKAESAYHPEAVSPVGAKGLMQIMPYTAEHLTRLLNESNVTDNELLDPQTNIRLGARYLSRLMKKFEGYVPLAAAGYNAGPHRVHNWLRNFGTLDMDEFIEHVPFVETRNYMKKVVRNYAVYNQLYSPQNLAIDFLAKPIPVRVSDHPSPRENWESID